MTELHQTYELVPDAEIQQTSFRERMACSRIGRAAIGGITAVSLAVGGTLATASSSAAESSHTYTVTGTDGEGVWLHGDPGAGDEGDLIKIMPEGTQFTADCYVNDTPIGERSNPVWLHGRDASGTEGYFTDYYSSSRWSAEDKSDLPPLCGETYQQPDTDKPQESITSVAYDGNRAANWARDHAKDAPPYNASCTWFVSNALWAGGLPKSSQWTNEGGFGRMSVPSSYRPGTTSAWAVDHFQEYIVATYPQTQEVELDGQRFQENAVPEASRGDVILYDWEGDGELDHATIVTDIADNNYPEVAEWSIYDGREPTPYEERGWTHSKKSNAWLQEKFPNVTAYLLDIDTTQTGEF